MSLTLDLSAAPVSARFNPDGKTLAEVIDFVSRTLRTTENEPEWITHANFIDAGCPDRFGLSPCAPWPDEKPYRRLSLSVERGNSEGWIISVDVIDLVCHVDAEFWKCIPLMRIKTLSRSQAWTIASIVTRLLDID